MASTSTDVATEVSTETATEVSTEAARLAYATGHITQVRAFGQYIFLRIEDHLMHIDLCIAHDQVGDSLFDQARALQFGEWVSARGDLTSTVAGTTLIRVAYFERQRLTR